MSASLRLCHNGCPERTSPECRQLVEAINSLPRTSVLQSTSGEGTRPLCVWFYCKSARALRFLGRCIDCRYWYAGTRWHIYLDNSDTNYDSPVFCLVSQGLPRAEVTQSIGEDAYREAGNLVYNMNWHINCKAYVDAFLTDLADFEFELTPNSLATPGV